MKTLVKFCISLQIICYCFNAYSQSPQKSNTSPPNGPSYDNAISSNRAVFITANNDGSYHRNENIYFQVNGTNWWDNVKLEIQREGGVGTRGGMFMDWGALYLIADWDNTSSSEDIIFGFDSNIKSQINEKMRLTSLGNLGIGISNPSQKLEVNGTIRSKEVLVEASPWPDFVFEKNYQLPTLKEVEQHIRKKGHLKDIPSAKEVDKNGIQLGMMNAKLLQKIEELTLYIIQQEKRIAALEKKAKQ